MIPSEPPQSLAQPVAVTPRPAPPPVVWPAFLALVTAFVVAGIGSSIVHFGVVLVALRNETLSFDDLTRPQGLIRFIFSDPWVLVATMLAGVLSFGPIAVLAARLEKSNVRERLRFLPRPRTWVLGLVATLGMVGLGQLMDSGAHLLNLYEGSVLQIINEVVPKMPPASFGVLLFFGSVGAGVGEELMFRGYIQTRLLSRWGRWFGIVTAATLFGVVHGDQLHTPIAFAMGLLLGWMTELCGSIKPAMIAHVLNNATSFISTRLVPVEGITTNDHLTLLVVGLIVGGIACVAYGSLARLTDRPAEVRLANGTSQPPSETMPTRS